MMFDSGAWEKSRDRINELAYEYKEFSGRKRSRAKDYANEIADIMIDPASQFLFNVYYNYPANRLETAEPLPPGGGSAPGVEYKNCTFFAFRNSPAPFSKSLIDPVHLYDGDASLNIFKLLENYAPERKNAARDEGEEGSGEAGTFFGFFCFLLVRMQEYYKHWAKCELTGQPFDPDQVNNAESGNKKAVNVFVSAVMRDPLNGAAGFAGKTIERNNEMKAPVKDELLETTYAVINDPRRARKDGGDSLREQSEIIANLKDVDRRLICERIMVVRGLEKPFSEESLAECCRDMLAEIGFLRPASLDKRSEDGFDTVDMRKTEDIDPSGNSEPPAYFEESKEQGLSKEGGIAALLTEQKEQDLPEEIDLAALLADPADRISKSLLYLNNYMGNNIVGGKLSIIRELITIYLLRLCLLYKNESDGLVYDHAGLFSERNAAINKDRFRVRDFCISLSDFCVCVLILIDRELKAAEGEIKKYFTEAAIKAIRETRQLPEAFRFSNIYSVLQALAVDRDEDRMAEIRAALHEDIQYKNPEGDNILQMYLEISGFDEISKNENSKIFHKISSAAMLARGKLYTQKEIASLTENDAARITGIAKLIAAERRSLEAYLEELPF